MENYKQLYKKHLEIEKKVSRIDLDINTLESKKKKLEGDLIDDQAKSQYFSGREDIREVG